MTKIAAEMRINRWEVVTNARRLWIAGLAPRRFGSKARRDTTEPEMAPWLQKALRLFEPTPDMVSLLDLTHGLCRWPLGDPTKSNWGYCGAVAASGQVYCARHRVLAYPKPEKPAKASP